jgi:uncharacterized protein (DUF1697 family)
MNTYIALLRGINVSGQKQIKMTELKALFEELKFSDVQTYIQSGNVIFKSKEDQVNKLESKVAKAIREKFGFDVKIIVKTPKEFEYVLKNNPFIKKKKEAERLYTTFLSEVPSTEKIKKLKETDYSPEEYTIDGKNIFMFFPDGYGKARLSNNLFENKLKVFATTRNWKTVNTLWKMAT